MARYLKILAVVVIVLGCYAGVRYLGTFIHDACTAPQEDCPPPFRILGELGYYATGGALVPFWTRG